MSFYERLNYSLGNEDWHVEEQALQVRKNDKVVCVTASGDRALHLLMTDCAEIISIDLNPIQNYLLELKLAAISQLDFEKYLSFLGCQPTPHRSAIYQELKSYLSSDAKTYWDRYPQLLKKGIIYQGFVERVTGFGAVIFKCFKNKKISTLFSFTDINEQRQFVAKNINGFFLKELLNIFLNTKLSKILFKDPGLIQADASYHPGTYLYSRIQYFLHNHLACKSPLLQLILMGKILPDAYFPYLTWEGFNKIRSNISRLRHKTDNVIKFMNTQNPNEFDCFSMSDIASYMPQFLFDELLKSIKHAAKPGARFCLREFLSKHEIPAELTPVFQRKPELEKLLEHSETNFVYRFFAGEIQKC